METSLQLSGEITPVLYRDVSMELAEFFLEEVTPAQGGSYHCCYRNPGWNLGVWSHPSDTLELLVTDQLPPPSLVALPGPVVAPGANVSLRCSGRLRGMSFALYRAGEAAPLQYRDSAEPWADFPLPGARAPGTYSCYYHTPSSPYVLSLRSEPLVIRADHGESGAPQPLLRSPGSDPGSSLFPSLGIRGPASLPASQSGGQDPTPSSPKSRSPGPLPLSTTTLRLGAVSLVSPWRLETQRVGADRGFRS
ncbi:osteoclast-associated immunoglobulin-like receptor isoform X3 [Meles meles]|uniref:osteoclast-associated immunoglobulin-like receptor isoform X3 n=1 Tax=Meles meles TaxID=9662 RepID=UPI001E69F695|nr:osteoclast-associated immunoglobulin-like receptor isoform X3 [Meles meles]XP_045844506.1 osteoclast-associated immunoglobulin-like receptor isoform X3 [Meles meles]XP_045844507.1 osteoclast-associated immunoglobulin-like receptor isoform X3 [Meles meles]